MLFQLKFSKFWYNSFCFYLFFFFVTLNELSTSINCNSSYIFDTLIFLQFFLLVNFSTISPVLNQNHQWSDNDKPEFKIVTKNSRGSKIVKNTLQKRIDLRVISTINYSPYIVIHLEFNHWGCWHVSIQDNNIIIKMVGDRFRKWVKDRGISKLEHDQRSLKAFTPLTSINGVLA